MAGTPKTIDQLPTKSSVLGTDYFPLDDGTQSYKTTWATLLALTGGIASWSASGNTLTVTLRDGSVCTFTPSDNSKQDVLTFDTAPTNGSTNPVTSGGVFTAVKDVADDLDQEAATARAAESANADAIDLLNADATTPGSVAYAIAQAIAGGGGGTSDYSDLTNKPQIAGVTLAGNKTAADLGLVAAETGKGLSSNDFTTALKNVVNALAALITSANNGKAIGIVNGALAAIEAGGSLPDGDEVSY